MIKLFSPRTITFSVFFFCCGFSFFPDIPKIINQFIPEKPDRFFVENRDNNKTSDENEITLEDTTLFKLKRGKVCKKIMPSMEKCTCEEFRSYENSSIDLKDLFLK